MTTPRVKQQQQPKKILSAKKGPIKGLRNVLAQPYETQWPVVSKEEGSCLEELLNRLLPGLRCHTQFVPWSKLRKMGKDERRAAREKLRQDTKKEENNKIKVITLGVNAVTRDLEKKVLSSILLDSKVESLLIKHVVIMAQNTDIPILLIPFLKSVTLENLGFASAALGLKRGATESSNDFNAIHREIVRIAHTLKSNEEVNSCEDLIASPIIEDAEMSIAKENSSKKNATIPTNPYKYRSTKEERIFVPPVTRDESSKDREELGDFIAIGSDTETLPEFKVSRKKQRYMDMEFVGENKALKSLEKEEFVPLDRNGTSKKMNKKKNSTYVSLKVKRIQGNNNRVKATKISKTKKKKSSLNKK